MAPGIWGSKNPEQFVALVVVCGWISERKGTTSGVGYPALAPPGTADPIASVAARVSKVPIWIFHGDADRVVPVDESRQMVAALKTLDADVQYTEFPGVNLRGIRHMHAKTYGDGFCGNEALNTTTV
jgi:predicted peptidase